MTLFKSLNRLLPSLLILAVSDVVLANSAYTPLSSERITENWRWHKYDPLEGKLVYCGTELSNGDLLFVGNNSFIRYDGYDISEEAFPDDYRDMMTFAVWAEDSGRIYLNTSIGLVTRLGDDWRTLLNYDHSYPQGRPLFTRNEDGLLIVGTPGGIYELVDGEANVLTLFEEGIGSLLGAGGKLFLSPSRENSVYDFPFTRAGIQDRESWNKSELVSDNRQSPFLFNGHKTGEVFALNFIRNSGIFRYSPDTESWDLYESSTRYRNNSFISGITIDERSMLIFEKSSTFALFEDKWTKLEKRRFDQPIVGIFSFKRDNGNIVIGGRGESVLEIDLSGKRWSTYIDLHFQCDDLDSQSWFISRTGKLISRNNRSGTWLEHSGNILDTPNVMICSRDGMVWAAGAHEGVAAICRYDGFSWVLEKLPELGSRICHISALELSDGRILFGSGEELPSDRMGLVQYTKIDGLYRYKFFGEPVSPVRIAGLIETEDGEIWTGGFEILKLDYNLNAPYQALEDLNIEWVDHIQSAPGGGLFAGQWERGLLKIDNGSWSFVDAFQETSGHFVSNMLRDRIRTDALWIATEGGISRLDSEDCVAEALPFELGMVREEGTLAQDGEGAIWVNKTERTWYFSNPDERRNAVQSFTTVRHNFQHGAPKVEIVDFEAKSTQPANVHFSWKGVDLWSATSSEKLRYSYKVNDGPWSPYSSETRTTLLNFDKGKHSFMVRVKDLDNNVSMLPAPVSFTVIPPVWHRPWFVSSGLGMIGITLLLLYLLVRQRINHLLQLDELKLQFFTNMSHELRTPLMLIIGPLESLLDKLPSGFDKSDAQIAHRNSKKILHLVDQILEFRKVEFSGIEQNLVQQDIIKDIRDGINLHEPLAREKSIDFITKYSMQRFDAVYDSAKLDRILSNLVTNAVKYTEPHGTILVRTEIEHAGERGMPGLKLSIEDDGEGISADKLKHIFEPFYRIQGNASRRARGVGLGLSLVKNLIDSMDGDISVESPVRIEGGSSKGTRFTVTLPLKPGGTSPVSSGEALRSGISSGEALRSGISSGDTAPAEPKYADEKVVLIVEDEAEIREYIGNELKSHFAVEFAANGVEGLSKAKAIVPDLILTDVLMPEMDGNELCERIRANESTSHIPVIALTALKSTEHELKTLTKGADDFLTKPVSSKVLRQKITNAIRSREQLQENFRKHLQDSSAKPDKPFIGSADDSFVEKVKGLIMEHLEDPFFDVEHLASKLGMSRMTLYRKIKAITGESPSELIRVTRLKTAASLLVAGELNISEIADRVGYQDLSHFSGSFKKYYDCSPSVYQKKNG